jgi:hypothetical protein
MKQYACMLSEVEAWVTSPTAASDPSTAIVRPTSFCRSLPGMAKGEGKLNGERWKADKRAEELLDVLLTKPTQQ